MTELAPMMTDNPAAVLTAAADRLRDLATNDLTPGRWELRTTPSSTDGEDGEDGTVWVACEHGSTVAVLGEAYTSAPRDGAWIVALSPAIAAAPIEQMLRQAATEMASTWPMFQPGTRRFIILTDEQGRHHDDTATTVWTEQTRWDAIQPRWGGAITFARRLLAATNPPAPPQED